MGNKGKGKGHGGTRDGAGRPAKTPPATANHGRDWASDLLEALNRPPSPSDSYEVQQWRILTEAQDLRIRLDGRKYVYTYKFGKPPQPIVGDDALPPVRIDISAIPMTRERA